MLIQSQYDINSNTYTYSAKWESDNLAHQEIFQTTRKLTDEQVTAIVKIMSVANQAEAA